MKCNKCGSENVTCQVVTEVKMTNDHHGVLWWLLIGFWWIPVKWIMFTVPALILSIFKPKRQKIKQKNVTMCVCQNCGNRWKI